MTILNYRRELEARGEIESQKEREGLDGKSYKSEITHVISPGNLLPGEDITDIAEPQPDPFETWFNDHVICGDALEIIPTLNRKFDLAIIDPPYGITTKNWRPGVKLSLKKNERGEMARKKYKNRKSWTLLRI